MNELATDREPTLSEMLDIAQQDGPRLARATVPDDRVIYAVWGMAWLVGFVALWLTRGDDPRVDAAAAADVAFPMLIVAAIVVNAVHIARRVRGVRGASATMGQRYMAVWFVGFATYGLLLAGLDRAGADGDLLDLVSPLLACFIVALLYVAGAAVWDDGLQFWVGVWIAACVGAAALVGAPDHHLVLGIGGGGALLAGAVLAHRRAVRGG